MKYVFVFAFGLLCVLSIVHWAIGSGATVGGRTVLVWLGDDCPARRQQIALFNELHPDINLVLDPTVSTMDKVIVQSLAGVGPDLFNCYDPFQLSAFVKSGIALDLTEDIGEMGLSFRRDVWNSIVSTCVYEGRVYGFPANVGMNGVWFNKDLFDKHSIPYPTGPWTWDEFIPVAQKLTVRDSQGRVRQFGFIYDFAFVWPHFLPQWGAHMYSEDGTRCTLDSPEAIAAFQLMYDLIYRYQVAPSPFQQAAMVTQGGWGTGAASWFGEGRAAMALGGRWWLSLFRNYERRRTC